MSDTENIDTASPAEALGRQGGPGTGMLGGRGAGVPTLEEARAELANSTPEERQEMLEIARRLLSAQSLLESATATAELLTGSRGLLNTDNNEGGDGSGGNSPPPPPPPANPMEAMFSRATDAPDLDISAANMLLPRLTVEKETQSRNLMSVPLPQPLWTSSLTSSHTSTPMLLVVRQLVGLLTSL